MATIGNILDLEDKLRAAREAQAKAEEQREQFRLFILESGHAGAFILWLARKNNADEELIKMLETNPQTATST